MDPVLGSFLGLITLLQIATLTYLWQTNSRVDEVVVQLNLRIDKVVDQIHDAGRETNRKIDDLAGRFGGAEQRIAHLEGGRTATNL